MLGHYDIPMYDDEGNERKFSDILSDVGMRARGEGRFAKYGAQTPKQQAKMLSLISSQVGSTFLSNLISNPNIVDFGGLIDSMGWGSLMEGTMLDSAEAIDKEMTSAAKAFAISWGVATNPMWNALKGLRLNY